VLWPVAQEFAERPQRLEVVRGASATQVGVHHVRKLEHAWRQRAGGLGASQHVDDGIGECVDPAAGELDVRLLGAEPSVLLGDGERVGWRGLVNPARPYRLRLGRVRVRF